jgi:hypothetical protein
MQVVHNFETPRNIFEKLIRNDEQLDMFMNGDNMFNFISTAYHLMEWIKRSPMQTTEQVKRLVRKAAQNRYIKICKLIVTAKVHYKIIIDDPKLVDGYEPDYTTRPTKSDNLCYYDGSKIFKFVVDGVEYDPFEFKQEIVNLYSTFFKVK